MNFSTYFTSFIIGMLLLAACNPKPDKEYDPDTSYWSMNQFLIDQYNVRKLDPVVIKKTVDLNGKIDSAFIPIADIDWATVYKVFGAADISNPSFYNQYEYKNFDDNFLEMSTMTYTAKDPNLFVQRLDINYDNISGKIDVVYAETNDDGLLRQKQQKLSYYVGKKVIVQETEKGIFSKEKNLTVTYEFR
ncbi:MAG: hypothetical protein JNM21_11360 [Taibaiella sp.]|nr:hypothetical protein [Taibaiella sp.]